MEQTSTYVTDWLAKRADLTPDRVGLVDAADGSETTYAEWNARADRTANYLRSLGVSVGDRVCVYSVNRAEYLDVFFACAKLGAVLQNLNWRLTVHELTGIVAAGEPSVLLYSSDWAQEVAELAPSMSSVRHVVAFDEARTGERSFEERDDLPDTGVRVPDLSFDHPWGIYYTGGTTGLPKGAVITHGNMTWNSVNTITSWGITGDHVAALQLPFFHIGGPNIFMMPLVHTGGRTVLCREFELDQTLDLIERGGLTHYVGVPTMYQMLQAHPRWESADFSGLELVISGGAPCPMPIKQRFWDKGIDFKVGYGLTEASGNNFWLPPEDVRRKPESVGYPIFHIDMKIIAGDGSVCGPDEEGELLIRGPHVTAGYWNDPKATADAIVDGWLHTGDVARRDAEGYYTIMGRSKDMFISGGENVYPAEVESVVLGFAGIAEAAVVGIPHEKWGEVGRACIVMMPGVDFDEAALRSFLEQRLAKFKLPREFVVLEELPKTAIGKIDKKLLATEEVDR